jgi:tetratricopeptide (TPR) repeat protein
MPRPIVMYHYGPARASATRRLDSSRSRISTEKLEVMASGRSMDAIEKAEKERAARAAEAERTAHEARAKAEAEAAERAAGARRASEARKGAAQDAAEQAAMREITQGKAAEKANAEKAMAMVQTLLKSGKVDEAVGQATEALRLMRRIHDNNEAATDVCKAKTLLGHAFVKQGRLEQALPLISEAHAAHAAHKDEAGRKDELLRCANLLGNMYRTLGMLEEAEQLLRETTKLVRAADGDRASTTVHFIFQHGTVLSLFEDKVSRSRHPACVLPACAAPFV